MGALTTYTKATVAIGAKTLAEEASVTVKHMSGAKEVNTTAKGFAGMSPGSPRLEISVKNAVPAAGFEYKPFQAIQNLEIVEISIFAAGKVLTTKGYITDSTFTHATDNESSLDFNGIFQYEDFE